MQFSIPPANLLPHLCIAAPGPPEYETSVAPSPRKNVIEEIRGNNPLAEAPGYSEGQTVVQPTIAALTRPPVPLGGTAMVEAPGAVGAAVREVPAGTTSTQYMAEFGPLHEGARVLPIPSECRVMMSERCRLEVAADVDGTCMAGVDTWKGLLCTVVSVV
jgi:hypothetical protein